MYNDFDIWHDENVGRSTRGPDKDGIYPAHMAFTLKHQAPYSYEPFYVYQTSGEVNFSVYSDRLQTWDYDKYKKIASQVQKEFGNDDGKYLSCTNVDMVQRFMELYYGEGTKLVKIIEYCNKSSGYPCWRFDIFVPES